MQRKLLNELCYLTLIGIVNWVVGMFPGQWSNDWRMLIPMDSSNLAFYNSGEFFIVMPC